MLTKLSAISLLFLSLILSLYTGTALAQGHSSLKELRWLKGADEEKFKMIEKQFSDISISMARIGYRYNELYFAGLDENWIFAIC